MPAETKESRNPELQKTTFLRKKKKEIRAIFYHFCWRWSMWKWITWQLKQLPEASNLPNVKLVSPFLPTPPNDSPLNLSQFSKFTPLLKPETQQWSLIFYFPSPFHIPLLTYPITSKSKRKIKTSPVLLSQLNLCNRQLVFYCCPIIPTHSTGNRRSFKSTGEIMYVPAQLKKKITSYCKEYKIQSPLRSQWGLASSGHSLHLQSQHTFPIVD